MAPKPRPRAQKSTSPTTSRPSDPLSSFPAPPSFVDSAYGSQSQSQPQRLPLKSPLQARTPIQHHTRAKQPTRVTAAQKQALIDNLRLEITDRARKLRTQYALQAASLRQRLEFRIYRVPASLRKLTMAEVLERHAQKQKEEAEAKTRRANQPTKTKAAAAPPRATKRPSDDPPPEERATKRPRVKTTKANTTIKRAGPTPAPPTTAAPAREVLSPKSHNPRTVPTSPLKSPAKLSTRPTSPLKPSATASPLKPPTVPANVPAVANVGTASSMAKTRGTKTTQTKSTKQAAVKKAVGTGGRGVKKTAVHVDEPEPETEGRVTRNSAGRRQNSGASVETVASSGTVVVHKAKGGVRAAAKTAVGSVRGKKVEEKKKPVASATVGAATGSVRGGRTLRKRA